MILNQAQLTEKKKQIFSYIKSESASAGSKYDANANVTCKNVATLASEIHKDINIQIRRSIVSDKISELFGHDLASEYNRQLTEHEIYAHDETSLLAPYCASISLYPLLLNGLKDLGGESGAPQHLSSFCGSFVNLMFAISSQFAGAVAAVELLNCFDHFARRDYGDDYLNTNEADIRNHLQHVVYALNQPAAARSYQAVFWNISIFDEYYFKSLFENFVFPNGESSDWESVKKLQKFFMIWFNKEREKAVLTFPVVTAAILTDGSNALDADNLEFLSQQLSEGNSFFIYNSDSADSLASCCRLRNQMTDRTFSHSSGAGGVSTGSINVITLNMNRLVQRGLDLSEQIRKIHKYQIAHYKIIEDMISAKMLPAYTAGFIALKKQFLTIGINGMVEAAESAGIHCKSPEYIPWVSEKLKVIYKCNRVASSEYGVMFNTEFVPAENLGVKFSKWDLESGLKVSRACYNSYFYPVEDDSVNILDKIRLHGKEMTQFLDGGSALHLNLETYLDSRQFKSIILSCIRHGCNYLCTNVKVTVCEDCGHVEKTTECSCKKCSSKNISHATRIIGYLKKISSWSPARKSEEARRFYH